MSLVDELPPLFPPQDVAAARAAILKRCPILGTMGSGKTRTALVAFKRALPDWREETLKRPVVVMCRVNAIPTWETQITKWLGVDPSEIGRAHGTPAQRKKVWRDALSGKYRFVITTPASFVRDAKSGIIPRDLNLFWDEYHHYARNRTKTWELVCSWTLHSPCIFPLTGTPMRQGPQDLFPILKLCNRRLFGDYWRFVGTWCVVINNNFGQEIVGPKNLTNFKEEVYGKHTAYMPKKETDKYLPKKDRQFIPIETTPFQRKQIQRFYEEMYFEMESGQISLVPNKIVGILRERQLLTCPKLLDPSWEWGSGVEALGELLEDLDTPRPVVFTDFAEAVPLIATYLRAGIKGHRQVHELRGGMKVDELALRVRLHNESEDDITVCSMQFAESFEFPRSSNCFVLGFNWSRDVCEQAEDRLRRAISESSNIKCFYLQYLNTVEGDVLQRLRSKDSSVRAVTPEDVLYSVRKYQHQNPV